VRGKGGKTNQQSTSDNFFKKLTLTIDLEQLFWSSNEKNLGDERASEGERGTFFK